jgi:isoquinoline 1-oxidoreductase subunit beta
MSAVEQLGVSRRQFLGGLVSSGAFVLAARVLPASAWAQDPTITTRAGAAAFHPSVYLGIEPDGTVFLIAHRSEMGTGIRTTLPMVAADELDADWSRVRIEQAIGDPKYGDQNTDGSRSMRDFYQVFRIAGATAKSMLITAAAAQWGVPASACVAANHEVVHTATGRRLGYGALAPAASALEVPKPETLTFKPRSAWRYVGQTHASYDLEPIVTGKAQFGHDIVREGMVYASIEHPPVLGGKIRSVDDTEALAVKGVQQTATLDTWEPPYRFKPLGGVAVIGANTWAVLQGRRKLKVAWDDGPHAGFDSAVFSQQLAQTVAQPGKVVRDLGNVDGEFAKGGRIVEATYLTPMAAHAPMEPPVAVAEFVDGKVTVWAPTQNPQAVQDTVAQAVGIDKKDVTCHVTLLGGGFGRKSKPDYCAEAAVLAKRLGKPVKVVWTREDDLKFDYFHTTAAVYHKAAVDARGRPTAWLTRSAFPPLGGMSDPTARFGGRGEISQGLADLPFDVANIRAENGPAEGHVRIGWFRAVANNQHAFALHSFTDELAHAAGRDPLELLLDLLGPGKVVDLSTQAPMYGNYGANVALHPIDTRRLRRVLETAAERGGWGKRKPGKGWGAGIAAHRSFNSYVASLVEVEVDDKGAVRIPRVEMVADAGVIVNPDRVRAQFESAAVMGTGLALYGQITAAGGRIVQSNFHDFQVARMNTAPVQTNVTLIQSDAPPTGIGEPGTPPVLAAVANAVFAATGKRVRSWPIAKSLA